jgi:predicted ABC-class ATPase
MTTAALLRDRLVHLEGQGYPAYKALRGDYAMADFTLHLDHIQADPFAAPSRVRVTVPQTTAQFPPDLWSLPIRAIALADYLTRQFHRASQAQNQRLGSGHSGLIEIIRPSQAILERSAARVTAAVVELRFQVGLPAQGRRIAGRQAATLLTETLPSLVHQTLIYANLDGAALAHHCNTAEDAEVLRSHLADQGLVAFIADGAILPRRSGVDPAPLEDQAIPFQSPPSLRVRLPCPHAGPLTGMGIRRGVTLIIGGGYHGKSTLLRAIEMGVYNHIPGDGREQVVTDPNALKVRAEDGRSVTGVDISPFINHLPRGQSTRYFCTANASGSTSQAASIMEALEVGARVLLVDEDTSATNFMIRDRRMQALIAKAQEPITPFIDKVRQLYRDHGLSTLLVMGGSGDYFDVADTVIALEEFCPRDVTVEARAIAATYQTQRQPEGGSNFGQPQGRRWQAPANPGVPKVKVRDRQQLQVGATPIDLGAVEQIVEVGQVRAIAAAILATIVTPHPPASLTTVLDTTMAHLAEQGLDYLSPWPVGDLVSFRRLELAAVLNRWRQLPIHPPG